MTTIDLTKKAAAAVVMAATVALVPPAFSASPATAEQSATFVLPRPDGRHAVGREVLHLVDRNRPDPWVPQNRRELMVSMYYPAVARTGSPSQYLTTTEARLFLEQRELAGVVTPETLAGTRSTARTHARPRQGRYPLVVLSPGFTLHRHTLTHVAEELASHGYVVAAVDHAYETPGTTFPGGRVFTCVACTATERNDREEQRTAYAGVAAGRARDVTFVLDRLLGAEPAWRHARLIDRRRIGMAGHSIGGNASAATMAGDPRVRAGINMDGTFFEPVPAEGLAGRPFLMLGTPDHVPGAAADDDQTWDRDWQRFDGWKRWLTVTGTGHLDFSDISVLGDQSGLPDNGSPLPGDRTAQLVRDYVNAFFDLHLRGLPQPLLNGPVPANPEIVFHRP